MAGVGRKSRTLRVHTFLPVWMTAGASRAAGRIFPVLTEIHIDIKC